jgi:hypothetical protein
MPLVFFCNVEHRPNIPGLGIWFGKQPPVQVIGGGPD